MVKLIFYVREFGGKSSDLCSAVLYVCSLELLKINCTLEISNCATILVMCDMKM